MLRHHKSKKKALNRVIIFWDDGEVWMVRDTKKFRRNLKRGKYDV